MPTKMLFKEANIEISYTATGQWLYVNWIGFQTVQLVKDGCERMLQLLKEKQCHKVLNDNTNVQGIWSGAAEWVGSDWFPRMHEAGLEKFAWVYSPSVFSQLSTDKALNHTKEGFVRTFYDIKDAKEWLK